MSNWFDAEAHADRALEMYERGRLAEAESELRKALSLNPSQSDWHFSLAMTLEASGRDLEALNSYVRVIELDPDQVDAFVAAGALCNRLRRYRPAIEWLDAAIERAPALDAAYAHKIDALGRLGEHDEAEATFYLAQHAAVEPTPQCLAAVAESLIDRHEFERAEWCLRECLRLEPNMPRLRARFAYVLAATGRHQRALQMYLRDLRDDPGNIDTLLDFGELLIELGRFGEASEKFGRVLELEPANVDARFRLGQVAMASGKAEHAHLEFELVLNLDPYFPGIRLALAEAMLVRERVDAARLHLRDELDALVPAEQQDAEPAPGEPRSDRAAQELTRFGDLLLRADMPAEAVSVFQNAIDTAGESAELLRKLAIARFRSGDTSRGGAVSRRVLRFEPRCVASIHNLALAALEQGQLRIAAGWIARGLRVDRNDDGLRRLRTKMWFLWLRRALRGRRF